MRGATRALGTLDRQIVSVQGVFAADREAALGAAQIITALAVAHILGAAPAQRLAALVKHLCEIGGVGQVRRGGFQKKPDQPVRAGR